MWYRPTARFLITLDNAIQNKGDLHLYLERNSNLLFQFQLTDINCVYLKS